MSSTRARFVSDSVELLLGPAAAPLVASHAGDVLEERPPLLGPQRECLVDHALADEQERVVGEVGGIEQVDEVAQPDPLLVQEVVVLARPVEPPPELEDAVVDRQQPVGVVEDDRHVGHADRGSLVGSGEDHVLRLAAPKRPPLLAQRPAQGVGEVALAGAVRPDDRADPAAELDERPLGERLEAVEAQREEPRRSGHPAAFVSSSPPAASSTASIASTRTSSPGRTRAGAAARAARIASSAWSAAAVSAVRRDGPSPTPERLPVDPDLDPEELLVVGTGRVDDPVVGTRAGAALGVLLQAALRDS